MPTDLALEKGLPANLDAERFVLGAILLDHTVFPAVAAQLQASDFSIEKHRRIFARMREIHERGERIDRVTVANELRGTNQLESCDGVTYLAYLDDGLPALSNFESYVRILKEKAAKRQLILLGQKLIDRSLMDDPTPAHELAAITTQELAGASAYKIDSRLRTVSEIIAGQPGGLNYFLAAGNARKRGIHTGFRKFDEMTGGLQRGELVILAARPSMGKTALALNIAAEVAIGRTKLSVAVFSLEMSEAALVTRLLCSHARVDLAKQRAGYLNEEERRRLALAAQAYRESRLYIDDTGTLNVMDIHSKLRRLRAEQGIVDLVVVDYLGLIAGHKSTDNRVRELGEITRYIKLMIAKDLNVPVLLLSQLNRSCETRSGDHRPILSDLRDSGDIEQDADLVAFIYRQEVYEPRRVELKGLAQLIVAKQRNGPTGAINLTWLEQFTKFENRTAAGEAEGGQQSLER